MDWSLVLASQDIPTSIERLTDRQWLLVVSAKDHERALQAIRQYRLENRGWRWRQELPGYDLTLHWGGVLWCVFLGVIYALSVEDFSALHSLWVLKSRAVQTGEWWRIFTAMFLHADLPHLFANITAGCLLLGLAMGRYGAGCGLLSCLVAGAVGNVLGLMIHSKPYDGLGASGMVMGALGLIIVPGMAAWKARSWPMRQRIKGVLAGTLLFILLGLNPAGDVAAHLGGFAAGVALGTLLSVMPDGVSRGKLSNGVCWLLMATLLGLAVGLSFGSK